jgi:AraC-like DNA-binding protein
MSSGQLTALFSMLNFGSLILLSFITFTNPLKVNRKANQWFAAFLLFWSLFWADEILGLSEHVQWQLFVRFLQYFTPLLFFISIMFFTQPAPSYRKSMLWHMILPFVYLMLLMVYYYSVPKNELLNYLMILLLLGQSLYYTFASAVLIRRHKKNVLLYASDPAKVDLFWLERIIFAVLLILIAAIGYNIIAQLQSLNLFMNITMLLVIYYIAFYSLRQKEIWPFTEPVGRELLELNAQRTEKSPQQKKIIPDEELISQKTLVHKYMQEQKPYLDTELNLMKLSELLDTTPHKLSYLVNAGFGQNFFHFVNQYRVEEAKKLLLDPHKDQLTILGIAFEAGFNSKTAFNNAFRKITGLTPSEFKERRPAL